VDRIDSVEAHAVDGGSRTWVFVVVRTSEGFLGVGEATLEWHTETVVAAVRELGTLVRGEDPARIQHLWQLGYRSRFWRGGPVLLSALSGLEEALWDIKGKRTGLPVYELLGGACREKLLLYANFPDGTSPTQMAMELAGSGLTGVKITPFDDPTLIVDGRSGALDRAIEQTEAVREAIGPHIRLAIDVHGRLSPAMAIIYARAVEPLDIWFLEEPALPEDRAGLLEVAQKTSIPVAAGERVLTRQAFAELLADRSVALVQPDLAHCGGIFEARVVAAMAEPRQIGFAPHNPMSAVNTMASAQVCATSPNFVALEHKLGDAVWHQEVVRSDAQILDGYLCFGQTPGLGIELDLDACAAHPPQTRVASEPRHADGSLAER
jgi:galactonate dehydratase